MWLSKIVPFAKTVLMKAVLNVKPIKSMKDKEIHAWFLGVHATTHTIPTVSADGQVKRKTPVHFVKRPGPL